MVAKAVATEVGANFINVPMSSIASKVLFYRNSWYSHWRRGRSSVLGAFFLSEDVPLNLMTILFFSFSGLEMERNTSRPFSL
jgi:hypothetical protein